MFRYLFLVVLFLIQIFAKNYTNALIYEESPYLRQHAHNPVHWLPWGEEAFKRAKKEHKPIFLSIGYSTCHWCHVMEKESFENEEIAKLINDYYIPIKVDKEERPDIDKYYQTVFAVMHHRSGGWPLTIIMTEDKKPFFSATYIPPEDGYGVKGMKTILPILAKGYKENRALIEKRADAVLKLVDEVLNARYVPVQLDISLATKALKELETRYDRIYGGFGKRVKFPQASTLELLLDIYLITKNTKALDMATHTLTTMAKSGLYDQIDGGFFRYTTDRAWEIPHFEKMLYTNAELIRLYTRAFTLTKNPLYKKVVRQTIAQMDKRFGHNGLYYSASDADTNGKEGGYFLFEYNATLAYLLKNGISMQEAKRALKNLAITPEGNFDLVLSQPQRKGEVNQTIVELLSKYRERRAYPFIDKKIITAWNAMYIEAKLRAYIFDEKYQKEALESLNKLLATLYKNGVLYHQKLPKQSPTKEAVLEDYAYLLKALTTAYQVSLDMQYLRLAKELFTKAKEKFYKKGVWYFSVGDTSLPADLLDSYYSSALATLYHAMLDMASLREDLKLFDFAKRSIYTKSALIYHNPSNYPTATRAVLRLLIGDVIIKAKNIQKYLAQIPYIRYPYILDKKSKSQKLMACKIDTCFVESSDFATIKKEIEALLQRKQKTEFLWHKKAFDER